MNSSTPSMHLPIGTDSPAATHEPVSGHLPQFGLLRFAGPDAASFLQGQLSNDTQRLSRGAPLLAAYSTPQGRVVAVMHLLPHSSGIMAIVPREIALPTLERLRKYVMRSKVQIQDVSDEFAVLGLHGPISSTPGALPAPGPAQGYAERDGIGIAQVGPDGNRHWAIGNAHDLERAGVAGLPGTALGGATSGNTASGGTASPDAASIEFTARVEHDWRRADIRSGMPQVYAATREMFVAQMLNLDLIDGISFTKGCFTGQEIIARTQHLGRIKRRLFRLRLPPGTWAIGQPVHLTDGRSGRLTELARTGAGVEALAVLNKGPAAVGGPGTPDAADSDSAARESIDATELPLPYSLG